MDCGVPFCQTGQILGGMTTGCPINNLIPEWNDLIYKRPFGKRHLKGSTKPTTFPNLPVVFVLRPVKGPVYSVINDPPVTIKTIECAIVDRGFEEGLDCPRHHLMNVLVRK